MKAVPAFSRRNEKKRRKQQITLSLAKIRTINFAQIYSVCAREKKKLIIIQLNVDLFLLMLKHCESDVHHFGKSLLACIVTHTAINMGLNVKAVVQDIMLLFYVPVLPESIVNSSSLFLFAYFFLLLIRQGVAHANFV